MKTIHYEAPGTRTRRPTLPAVQASVPQEPSPESAAPFWFRVVPLLMPGIAMLLVILTGVIWATVL